MNTSDSWVGTPLCSCVAFLSPIQNHIDGQGSFLSPPPITSPTTFSLPISPYNFYYVYYEIVCHDKGNVDFVWNEKHVQNYTCMYNTYTLYIYTYTYIHTYDRKMIPTRGLCYVCHTCYNGGWGT